MNRHRRKRLHILTELNPILAPNVDRHAYFKGRQATVNFLRLMNPNYHGRNHHQRLGYWAKVATKWIEKTVK